MTDFHILCEHKRTLDDIIKMYDVLVKFEDVKIMKTFTIDNNAHHYAIPHTTNLHYIKDENGYPYVIANISNYGAQKYIYPLKKFNTPKKDISINSSIIEYYEIMTEDELKNDGYRETGEIVINREEYMFMVNIPSYTNCTRQKISDGFRNEYLTKCKSYVSTINAEIDIICSCLKQHLKQHIPPPGIDAMVISYIV